MRSLTVALICWGCGCPLAGARIGDGIIDLLTGREDSPMGPLSSKLVLTDAASGEVALDQFIVYFDDSTSMDEIETKAQDVARATGGDVVWIYKHAFKGVALSNVTVSAMSVDSVVQRMDIRSIQQDQSFTLDVRPQSREPRQLQTNLNLNSTTNATISNGTRAPTSVPRTTWPRAPTLSPLRRNTSSPVSMIPTVPVIPMGLDRIDQVSLPLDGKYKARYNGSGVIVYVLDTGLLTNHSELHGRASCGMDFFARGLLPNLCKDGYNHGTHVAATIAGRTTGVAPGAKVVSVTLFNEYGSSNGASYLAGLDYLLQQRRQQPKQPMVANLSFGKLGRFDRNEVVKQVIDAGIVVVVSAGNDNINVRRKSPANTRRALTVGASDSRDERAPWSNYGRMIDLYAPGVDIRSASSKGSTDYVVFSGTSMATPHVAGAAALYLQRNPKMTPRQVRRAMLKDATCQWRFSRRSPNKLLYTGHI